MRKRGIALLCAGLLTGGLVAVGPTVASGQAPQLLPPGGGYRSVGPARILDTRQGLGAPTGATQQVTVDTAGVAGIPTGGVSAVAVNLTVTSPAAAGFLTAFAAGTSRPTASNSNYVKGQTVAATAIVPVDAAGRFTIYSSAKTQLIADVSGYFTTPQAAAGSGLFSSLSTPARLMDTRIHLGGDALGPGGITTLQVTGTNGVPASDVSAVLVNITAVAPTASGNVTAYPAGIATPVVSSLNFARGETRANRAIVPVGQGGKIAFRNAVGTTQLVVDLNGYFTAGGTSGGSYYVARMPSRLLDTRTSPNPWSKSAGSTNSVGVTIDATSYIGAPVHRAPSLISIAPTASVWLTLTAVAPRTNGFVTAYASKTARPTSSDLNPAASLVTANAAAVPVGAGGTIDVYSSAAEDFVVDLDGYFAQAPTVPTRDGLWAWGLSGLDTPFLVNSTAGLKAVTDGWLGFALTANGTLRGWNRPTFAYDHLQPHGGWAENVGSVTQLVGSPSTTYTLHTSGKVLAQGGDSYGEYGDGTRSDEVFEYWSLEPPYTVAISSGTPQVTDVTMIGAASHDGYAVKSDGTVWAWGRAGQLGNGATTDSYLPVQVTGLSNAISIAGGNALTYAVDSAGQLWRWGALATSTGFTPIPTPQQVSGACAKGVSVVANSLGGWELCDDGTVWQLDRQAHENVVHLSGPGNITAIASAPSRGVQALTSDGTVWRFDSPTNQFVQVYGLNGITAIGGSSRISYALR